MATVDEKWYFTKEQLANSPSRRAGIDADKELSYRQQAANFIQDMGQRLAVTQLCINTAIVYMHRFYLFHSLSQFHRNAMAAAALFLAAKVEEQPRKLEHVIKVAHLCLQKGSAPETKSEQYLEQAQDLVFNENVLLQTLGFEVAIDHPHTHVVRCCQLVKASKELAQTSYFMASNSLHLTTMCLQYKPTVVACFCIHLACKWSNWEIPQSNEGKHWFWYVDKTVTIELLQHLTTDFLQIFDKCPSRLKRKIMSISANQSPNMNHTSSLTNSPFETEPRKIQSPANAESAFFNRFHHDSKPDDKKAISLLSKSLYDFQNKKDHDRPDRDNKSNSNYSGSHGHVKQMPAANKNLSTSTSTSGMIKNTFRHHHHHHHHQKMDPKMANIPQKQHPPNPQQYHQHGQGPGYTGVHKNFDKGSILPDQLKKQPVNKIKGFNDSSKKPDFLEQRKIEDIRKLIEKPLTLQNVKPENPSLLNKSLPVVVPLIPLDNSLKSRTVSRSVPQPMNDTLKKEPSINPKRKEEIPIEKPVFPKQRSLFSPEKSIKIDEAKNFQPLQFGPENSNHKQETIKRVDRVHGVKPEIDFLNSVVPSATLPSQIFEKKPYNVSPLKSAQTISALLQEPLAPIPSLIPKPPLPAVPQKAAPEEPQQQQQPVPAAMSNVEVTSNGNSNSKPEKSSKTEQKKKKKEKHKHRDRDKSSSKEKHKHKHKDRDKDKSKSRSSQHSHRNTQEKPTSQSSEFPTPIKITISKDKLVDVPDSAGNSLKIKIPKERLKGSEISNVLNLASGSGSNRAQPATPLKIKIRTDTIARGAEQSDGSRKRTIASELDEPPLKKSQNDAISIGKK